MTTGDPPHRYHNIDCIGRRHKPLAPLVLLCCYQVVIGYNMWWPPHYMGGTCYWCPTQTQLVPIHTYYNTESYRNSTQKHSTGYEMQVVSMERPGEGIVGSGPTLTTLNELLYTRLGLLQGDMISWVLP
jgi:hypothetical protein